MDYRERQTRSNFLGCLGGLWTGGLGLVTIAGVGVATSICGDNRQRYAGQVYKSVYGEGTDEQIRKLIEQEEIKMLQRRGVWGPHQVVDLRGLAQFSVEGSMSGGMFLLAGSIDGRVDGRTTQLLQFAWATNTDDPEIVISQLPIDKVTFKEHKPDTTNPEPTISFRFDMSKFVSTDGGGIYTATVKDLGSDPHSYVLDGIVTGATVTMTQEQFAKFRAAR